MAGNRIYCAKDMQVSCSCQTDWSNLYAARLANWRVPELGIQTVAAPATNKNQRPRQFQLSRFQLPPDLSLITVRRARSMAHALPDFPARMPLEAQGALGSTT